MNTQERKQSAERCADTYVAHNTYCHGCPAQSYCGIDRKWREAHGPDFFAKLLADPAIRQNVTVVVLN